MSIEEDFEAFREIGLEVQDRLNMFPDIADEDLQQIYADLDPLLEGVIEGRRISIQGGVNIPLLGKDNMVVGIQTTKDSVFGSNNGVFVVKHDESCEEVTLERWVIGVSVLLDTVITRQTIVERTRTEQYAFGPLDTVRVMVPDEELEFIDTIRPEPDDHIAEEIDACVYVDPVDFHRLRQIFEGSGNSGIVEQGDIPAYIDTQNSMLAAFYLLYLNTILPLDEFDIALSTERIISVDINGRVVEHVEEGYYTDIEEDTRAQGFRYIPELNLFCIGFDGFVEGREIYVPFSNITNMSMKHVKEQGAEK
ncbi:MAG: hypothetical protein NTX11_00755 [Candidatus Saccharibacteria bacterium]|nr:hypothetical protein [Candidatus Saccharibacteria bacterium]